MTRPARIGEAAPPNSEEPQTGTAERARELAEALEEVRREAAAREAAEQALRKAQKLEAVGQLAGGIAHDFNNHLTSILGGLFLIERRIEQGRSADDLRHYISTASVAARRAGALAQRLLRLARRQPLPGPERVDVNEAVASLEDLLRSALGPSVTLELALTSGAWPTVCDPDQLDNAVLNLAINARDAMPGGGGHLMIRTANIRRDQPFAGSESGDVHPGDHVLLQVTDTGVGMAPDVVARILEPFFTTKAPGQGTGLGIPMVHAFVKQSGGHMDVRSEPGHGTTVRLYLPRQGVATPRTTEAPPAVRVEAPRGKPGETILIIDRISVRALLAEALEDLGYVAIGASDGPSGLHILQSDVRVDLLVTEIGLPGPLNGRQLAEAARERRPGLKVLFITSYAPDAAVGGDTAPGPGTAVITKPLALDIFVTKVRSMLSGPEIAPAVSDQPGDPAT